MFQSAPRILMRGDADAPSATGTSWVVSIRAPHSHAGRHSAKAHTERVGLFQSAPRILMRGDVARRGGAGYNVMFQSAPRILMRGDPVHPAK